MIIKKNSNYRQFTVLILLGCLIYARTQNYPLLNWDDDKNIFNNPYIKEGKLFPLLNHAYYGLYIPVTSLAWFLLNKISTPGLGLPFHLFSLIVHLVNSILVYFFILTSLLRLKVSSNTLAIQGAFVGAVLFCCHPLQVDAVTWASALRDLLATFFGLCASIFYIRNAIRSSRWMAFLFFLLGTLCKPSLVALPIALFCMGGTLGRGTPLRRAHYFFPWIIVSLCIVWITRNAQDWALYPPSIDVISRICVVVHSFSFYLLKGVFPFPLALNYQLTLKDVLTFRSMASAAIILSIGSGFLFLIWRSLESAIRSALLGAIGMFICLLFPVLGAVSFPYQVISTVANHYFYMPSIAFFLVVGILYSHFSGARLAKVSIGFTVVLFVLLSFWRTQLWASNQIFFSQMIAENPRSVSAIINLGNIESGKNNLLAAKNYYRLAREISPEDPNAFANYAAILERLKSWQEIIDIFGPELIKYMNKPILPELKPYFSEVSAILAIAQIQLAHYDDASETLCRFSLVDAEDQKIQKIFMYLKTKMPSATCDKIKS